MKNTTLHILMGLLVIGLIACKPAQPTETTASAPAEEIIIPNSYLSIFEIPASDISRAIDFYQAVLDLKIEFYDLGEMKMGVLPYENQAVTATIVQGEGYQPSTEGITVYLNAGDDLQPILDRVAQNGGEVLLEKPLMPTAMDFLRSSLILKAIGWA
ncbi:MAG: VOC family protein [Bacteroidota bacterium]